MKLRSAQFWMAVVGVLWLSLPDEVGAHARLVRSAPATNAELTKPPEQIELCFNELLDEGFHSIEVFPAKELTAKQRTSLTKDKPKVAPKDRTRISVNLKSLPPGDYVVQWRVLSRDGHSAPGRFNFRVLPPK